jgi:hypothetical protein
MQMDEKDDRDAQEFAMNPDVAAAAYIGEHQQILSSTTLYFTRHTHRPQSVYLMALFVRLKKQHNQSSSMLHAFILAMILHPEVRQSFYASKIDLHCHARIPHATSNEDALALTGT